MGGVGAAGTRPDPVRAYAEAVVAGEIVAGRLVRMACQRHLDDVIRQTELGLRWDQDTADFAIDFFGHLNLPSGAPFTLRVDGERLVGDIVGQQNARAIGIDRWNRAWLTPRLQAEGVDVVEVGQGYARLSAPAQRIAADIASGLVHHDGNPVLRWMVANAVATMDAAGNIKPDREKSSEKIDGVAAWCDALFVWAAQPVVDQAPEVQPFIFFDDET